MLGKVLLVHRWVGCFFFFCCIWSVLYHFPFTVKTENKNLYKYAFKKKKENAFAATDGTREGLSCCVNVGCNTSPLGIGDELQGSQDSKSKEAIFILCSLSQK